MNELIKRIGVALIGIPLLVGLTYLGGWYFFGLIVVIGLVSQWEFYQIQRIKGYHPQNFSGLFFGFLILLDIQTQSWILAANILVIAIIVISVAELFRKHKDVSANIGLTLLGIFYIPTLLGALLFTRVFVNSVFPEIPEAGFRFILLHFFTIWTCDTFAYGFGTFLGRHPLYKKVSPNKSVEGFIAGIMGSLLIYSIAKQSGFLPINWTAAILFGLIVGVLGQVGDLVESWYKRDAGVKDSSTLLPGHGGMLDRFDSIIFTSPLMLMLAWILLQ